MTALSGSLRIVMSLLVVGTAIYAGYVLRSPWIVLPMTVAFTLLYVAGKWEKWRAAAAEHGLAKTAIGLLITLPIQMIVSGLFYVVGFGLGALTGGGSPASGLEAFDWQLVGGLCAVALPTTALITWLERHSGEDG